MSVVGELQFYAVAGSWNNSWQWDIQRNSVHGNVRCEVFPCTCSGGVSSIPLWRSVAKKCDVMLPRDSSS